MDSVCTSYLAVDGAVCTDAFGTQGVCGSGTCRTKPSLCIDGDPCKTPTGPGMCKGGVCYPTIGACESAADCGKATECATPTCVDGTCGATFAAQGTPCAGDTAICDGTGMCLSDLA